MARHYMWLYTIFSFKWNMCLWDQSRRGIILSIEESSTYCWETGASLKPDDATAINGQEPWVLSG